MRRRALLAALLLSLAACGGTGHQTASRARPGPSYDGALSVPRQDPVYPEVGDAEVDALHYDLALRWNPGTRMLHGDEALTFRATADATSFRLDLSSRLRVSDATLDGHHADVDQRGQDLVVDEAVSKDAHHVLHLVYDGAPAPVPAPSTRKDLPDVGFTVTGTGSAWTMQEPYGGFTWYAVDDQPADKAYYDFALDVPDPMVGVANGDLTSRTSDGRVTHTVWHLDRPTASYLVTVAFDDFTSTTDHSSSGVPITYWVPRDRPDLLPHLRTAPAGLDWLESRLGPYPGTSLGFVVVPSTSGMETQSMITLGEDSYDVSPAVVVHEMAHQWYGDEVTPRDWSDLWMNEGMTTYLQALWTSEHGGPSLASQIAGFYAEDAGLRAEAGPPAAYDPGHYGASNVYYPPAVMWDQLRRTIGDPAFYSLVRAWPSAAPGGSADRAEYLAWVERRTGLDLRTFFHAWLLGRTTPPLGLLS